jgi:hypothetical protein
MKTTIPEKLYVTIQYKNGATLEDDKKGFATEYAKNAAFRQRKERVERYAYGYGATFDIDDDDGTISGKFADSCKIDPIILFGLNCYPLLVENIPVPGFRVANSVRRGGRWGSGDVVWNISDPRGFELEISSANFAKLILNTTVINGEIQGNCIWGKDTQQNVLLSESSDVYQEAKILTSKVGSKLKFKDIQPGDIVEVLRNKVPVSLKYLGKYYSVTTRSIGYTCEVNKACNSSHLFSDTNGNSYEFIANPHVSSILTKADIPLNTADFANEFSKLDNKLGIPNVILISPTKIDEANITSKLVPVSDPVVDGEWNKIGHHTIPYIVKFESGEYGIAARGVALTVAMITLSLQDNLFINLTQQNQSPYYRSMSHITNTISDIRDVEVNLLEVSVNGYSGKVTRP